MVAFTVGIRIEDRASRSHSCIAYEGKKRNPKKLVG